MEEPGAQDLGTKEHYHWTQASKAFASSPFLFHVNRWTNFDNNSHAIVLHQSRPLIRPRPPILVTQAFGNLMAPKIVRCLGDSQLIVRQKTMTWAVEYLCVAENRVRCFKAGLLQALMKVFDETDPLMLEQLALAFKHVAECESGRRQMSWLGAIKGLLNMLKSDNRILRRNAFEALSNASNSQTVRDELVYGEDTLKYVLDILVLEYDNSCLTAGITMLFNCLRGGLDHKAVAQLLKANGVAASLQLTRYSDVRVKEAAARLLCLLALSKDARKVSVDKNAVVTLLELLKNHQPILVQAAGAAALMGLTINVDAKKQVIGADGVALIPPLIIPEDEILCLNILQLLTNMGEHPQSRKALEHTIPELRKIIDRSNSAILKRWARYGIQQLLFKHRPFTWEGV